MEIRYLHRHFFRNLNTREVEHGQQWTSNKHGVNRFDPFHRDLLVVRNAEMGDRSPKDHNLAQFLYLDITQPQVSQLQDA